MFCGFMPRRWRFSRLPIGGRRVCVGFGQGIQAGACIIKSEEMYARLFQRAEAADMGEPWGTRMGNPWVYVAVAFTANDTVRFFFEEGLLPRAQGEQ